MRSAARLALTLAVLLAATLALVPVHWLAIHTRLMSRRRMPRLWNRLVLAALGWRVRVEGAPAKDRPLLLVSNHVSWGDILVISAHADITFIAKSEVRGWPLFGFLAKLQDTVFIDRDDKRGVGRQAAEIAARLERGDALVLFAEGTTADGNHLLPFKSSLFAAVAIAIREAGANDASVQPLALAYTRLHGLPMNRAERDAAAWTGERTLAGHLWLLARRGPLDVTLAFGPPLPYGGSATRKAMAARAETEVRRLMAEALRG